MTIRRTKRRERGEVAYDSTDYSMPAHCLRIGKDRARAWGLQADIPCFYSATLIVHPTCAISRGRKRRSMKAYRLLAVSVPHRSPDVLFNFFGPEGNMAVSHEDMQPARVSAAGGDEVGAIIFPAVEMATPLSWFHHVHVGVANERPA